MRTGNAQGPAQSALLFVRKRIKSRVLVSIKSNVSAAVDGMRFQILAATDPLATDPSASVGPDGEPPMQTVHWSTKPLAMTADEIIASAAQSAECGPALEEACEWLRSALAGGEQPANELKRIAKEDGIQIRTLVRAKQHLGGIATRTGFGLGGIWIWQLPDGQVKEGQQPEGQSPAA